MPRTPDRGEIVWIALIPHAGHGQSGRRPALVLSPVAYNRKVGLALLCPITAQAKGYPFEVRVLDGLPVAGVILSDQVKSLDWRARKTETACVVSPETVQDVLVKLTHCWRNCQPWSRGCVAHCERGR